MESNPGVWKLNLMFLESEAGILETEADVSEIGVTVMGAGLFLISEVVVSLLVNI